ELATFGAILRFQWGGRCWLGRERDSAGKFGNRCQDFPPVPEQDPYVLEVLIGQMAEDRKINSILGKTFDVLGHLELFEPVRNLLHRGHQGLVVAELWPTATKSIH